MKTFLTVLALGGTLLAGCASSPQNSTPPALGSSVRQMIQAQTYNPQGDDSAPGVDAQKAATSIENYRTDKYSRRTTQLPVDLSIGN